MHRGPVGLLIAAILLVAICAQPALAGRPPRPAKVSVQPRLAASHDREVSPAVHQFASNQPSPREQPPEQLTEPPAARQVPQAFDPSPTADPLTRLLRDVAPAAVAEQPAPVAEQPAPVAEQPVAEPLGQPPVAVEDYSMIPVRDRDLERLRARIANLEQDRDLRRLTDRAREVQVQQIIGDDVTDDEWTSTWGGRIQADIVNWADDVEFGGRPNFVAFRRLRFFTAGEGYGVWNYKLELDLVRDIQPEVLLDFGGDNIVLREIGLELEDAYVGIMDLPLLGYVRAGHFKVPIGLEAMTSSRYLTFLERGLPRRLLPGREFGLAMYRYFPNADVTLAAGVFYDELSAFALQIVDDNQGYRAAMRATWAPWYDEFTEGRYYFHTGASFLYTHDTDDVVRFQARPEIFRSEFLIDTDNIVATHVRHAGAEMAWVHGPLSLQGEVIYSEVNVPGPGVRNFWGAYGFISCFLTGEHRPYDREEGVIGRVEPFENFWLVNTLRGCAAGWGAWEVAARLSYMEFKEIDGQELLDVTTGLNWYWNPHTRMMLNWIHPFRHNYSEGHAQGDIVGVRFQVDF